MSDRTTDDQRIDEDSSWVTMNYGGQYDWYDDSDEYTYDAFIGTSIHIYDYRFYNTDTAGDLAAGTAATEREDGYDQNEQYDYDYDTGVCTYYKNITTDIIVNLISTGYETWGTITTEGVEYTKHEYRIDWQAIPPAQVTDVYTWVEYWAEVMEDLIPDVDPIDPPDLDDLFGDP